MILDSPRSASHYRRSRYDGVQFDGRVHSYPQRGPVHPGGAIHEGSDLPGRQVPLPAGSPGLPGGISFGDAAY